MIKFYTPLFRQRDKYRDMATHRLIQVLLDKTDIFKQLMQAAPAYQPQTEVSSRR